MSLQPAQLSVAGNHTCAEDLANIFTKIDKVWMDFSLSETIQQCEINLRVRFCILCTMEYLQ